MDELAFRRIRDDVLQAMYWMRAEGLLDLDAGGYALTAAGVDVGKRTFAEEFADLTRPGHGECDDDCWCHDSPEAAADCLAERRGTQHVHG